MVVEYESNNRRRNRETNHQCGRYCVSGDLGIESNGIVGLLIQHHDLEIRWEAHTGNNAYGAMAKMADATD